MNLANVHVVLFQPRWARNLGAVARAMKNFGLKRLTVVSSQIGSWSDAWRMAVHAHDVLDTAVQADDLDAVLAPSSWVVGTTNDPPAGTKVLTPREVAAEAAARDGDATLLFGGEINGLNPKHLLRCHAVSVIPTAPEQSSLNLAQAVAVFGAELFAASGAASPPPAVPMASAELMQRLETALRHLLETSAWRDANRGKHAIAELMQPLWRAQLTENEVHAWLTALNKAVQRDS